MSTERDRFYAERAEVWAVEDARTVESVVLKFYGDTSGSDWMAHPHPPATSNLSGLVDISARGRVGRAIAHPGDEPHFRGIAPFEDES